MRGRRRADSGKRGGGQGRAAAGITLALGILGAGSARGEEPSDPRFSTVVSASRTAQKLSEAAVPMDVITRGEIERSGARDAAEVLALHPSVQVERSFSGAGAYIQGLEPQHVLVLVDGQRTIGRVNGTIDLARFPVERIEQIEVVRGASSVLYGSDALGGVINIITRKAGRRFEGDAALQYGTLNALDLRGSVGTRLRWGSATVNAGWHRRDAYRLDPEKLATSGGAFDEKQVSAKIDARLGERFRLGAAGSYLRRRSEAIDSYDSGAILDRTNLTETADVSLTPEAQLGRFKIRLVAQYSYFRDQYLLDQRGGTQLDDIQDTREHLGRADAQVDVRLPGSHVLTAGGEFLYERLFTPRLEGGTGDRVRGAVFAQDQWRISKRRGLSVIPALRFDADSQFGQNLAPKLAIRFAPLPQLTARASYGAGFRAPSFKELLMLFENTGAGYVVQGNLALKPETSHSVNLGLEVTPGPVVVLSANFFRNDLKNLIQPTLMQMGGAAGPQRFMYGNIATAYTQGLELGLRLRAAELLSAELNYTLTDSQDTEADRPLEGRPRHRGNLTVTARHKKAGVELMTRLSLVGPRPYYTDDDGDGTTETTLAPTYAMWDARLGIALPAHLQAFVGGQNLLNAGDKRFLAVPPRTAFLGLSGRFEHK